MKSILI